MAQIVPKDRVIEVEAALNKYNYGRASKGQKAIVKFRAFPYQSYGSITGKVLSVSPVSSVGQDDGVYVRISLQKEADFARRCGVDLTPYMSVNVVVVIEKIPLIKYLYRCIINRSCS